MITNESMKKTIQIFTITLQLLAVFIYIGTIRAGIAWFRGDIEVGVLVLFIVLAIIVQTISSMLRSKYPNLVDNAADVVYTSKELKEKKAGINKTPIVVKILLVIPITFALGVVSLGLYALYLFFTGRL